MSETSFERVDGKGNREDYHSLEELLLKSSNHRRLDLSNAKLTTVPPGIESLSRLTDLDLSHNRLTTLPSVIGSLTLLRTLDLDHNKLTILPGALASLTNLERLGLSDNRITLAGSFSREVAIVGFAGLLDSSSPYFSSQFLSWLKLCHVSPVTEVQCKLLLTYLDKTGDVVIATEIPEDARSICIQCFHPQPAPPSSPCPSLVRLKFVGPSSMYFLDPAWFRQCPALIHLDVRGHNLRTLPSAVASIHTVHFTGNPDLDIANMDGWREYMQEREKRAVPPQRLKLLLVGQEGAGKTTLLECLLSKTGRTDVKKNLSTDGISEEILRFSPRIKKRHSARPLATLTIHCFDFAGQELYYPSHELFMSRRSIFLIVSSAAELSSTPEEALKRVRYWLQKVKTFVGESRTPVILVLTHWDSISKSEASKVLQTVDFGDVGLEVLGPIPVSCKTGDGVTALRQDIEALARDPKFFPDISEYTVQVEAKLRSLCPDEFGRVSITEAESVGENLTRTRTALDYLTANGAILHFEGTRERPDTACYIVRPTALADLFKDILTSRHSFVHKSGELQESDLFNHIWKRKDDYWLAAGKDPLKEKSVLVDVLEQFELVVRSEAGKLLVPSLLPETASLWYEEYWGTKASEIGRIIEMKFVLKGFFPKILHRCYNLGAQIELAWRSGVLLTRSDAIGSITLIERNLSIRVRYEDGRSGILLFGQLLGVVESVFEGYAMGEEWLRLKITIPFRGEEISYAECVERYQRGEKSLGVGPDLVPFDLLIPEITMSHLKEIDPEKVKLGDAVGEGGFGVVYSGQWRKRQVAVKTVKVDVESSRELLILLRDFTREAEIMSRLKHPCLVRLFGLTRLPDHSLPSLVMEFVGGGTLWGDFHFPDEGLQEQKSQLKSKLRLRQLLAELFDSASTSPLSKATRKSVKELSPEIYRKLSKRNFDSEAVSSLLREMDDETTRMRSRLDQQQLESDRRIPFPVRTRLLLDLALGLEFLHKFSPPLVHNDLRSPNVFLLQINDSTNQVGKLADYGMTRVAAGSLKMGLGSWQWLAPEVLDTRHTATFTIQADMYSLGIVGWEVLNGPGINIPFSEYENQYQKNAMITAIRDDNLRPSMRYADETFAKETTYSPLRAILMRCLLSSPSERPPAELVVYELKNILGIPGKRPAKQTRRPALRLVKRRCFDIRTISRPSSWICACDGKNTQVDLCQQCERPRPTLRVMELSWKDGHPWLAMNSGIVVQILETGPQIYAFPRETAVVALCHDRIGVWAATDRELLYIEKGETQFLQIDQSLGTVIGLVASNGAAWLVQASEEDESTVSIYRGSLPSGQLKIKNGIVRVAGEPGRVLLVGRTSSLVYENDLVVNEIQYPRINPVAAWIGQGKICIASLSEVLHFSGEGKLVHRVDIQANVRSVCGAWIGTVEGVHSRQGRVTGSGEMSCLLSADGLLWTVDNTARLLCAYKEISQPDFE